MSILGTPYDEECNLDNALTLDTQPKNVYTPRPRFVNQITYLFELKSFLVYAFFLYSNLTSSYEL